MKLLALILCAASLAPAAVLRVVVRDPSGAFIPNATVRAGETSLRTSGRGEAVFQDLPEGRTEVSIQAPGFAPYVATVNIKPGRNTLERTLPLAARKETVDVRPDRREEQTDPRGSGFSTTLTEKQLAQLPDDPELMEQMLKDMAGPGAVLRVDGFRGGRLPHKSQIQSIRFRLTPYSAEEHDDGFVLIDVVTKPGLGEWHGDLSFAIGDEALNARNAFAPSREPQQSRRFDVNLLGPILRNRTSSSFSFSRNDGYDSRASRGVLPGGPFSDLILLPNSATHAGARFQHTLARSQALRGEYQFDRTERTSAGSFDLPERRSASFNESSLLRVSMQGSISDRLVNELRFQAQLATGGSDSLTAAPAIVVLGAFNRGGANVDNGRASRTFELTDHLSFSKGRHSFRTGGQIEHLRYRGRDFTNGFGTTVYSSLDAFLADRPAQYSRRSAEVTVGYRQTRAGAYFQDDMRLRKNLSLSLGLRQEGMSQIADRFNPAPRAGLAWAPFKGGKTTVRGGLGVLYQWYEGSLYEETLRLNGAAQADLVTSSAGVRLPGFIRTSDSLRLPYVIRTSIALQQQLPGGLNLIVDFRRQRDLRLFRSRNVNTPGSGYAYLLELESAARSSMRGLLVALSSMPAPDAKGWRARLFWNAHYFLAKSMDEVSSALTPPSDSLNARADWGPSALDIRHRFSTMAQATVWGGWRLGAFFTASSAAPFNITTGYDSNRDTFFNDRPEGVARNSARGAGQVNLSMRLSWSRGFGHRSSPAGLQTIVRIKLDGSGGMPDMPMGRPPGAANAAVRLQLYAQATNVVNRTNPTAFVGVLTSPFFGQPSMALPPRRLEAGLRLGF
jgi:hypothetical protein